LLKRNLFRKKFGIFKRDKLRHTKPKLREHGDDRTAGIQIVCGAYMRRPNESYIDTDNDGDDDEET